MKKSVRILLLLVTLIMFAFLVAVGVLNSNPEKIICPRCDNSTTTANFECDVCGYKIPYFETSFLFRNFKVIDIDQLEEDYMHFKNSEIDYGEN